MRLWFLESAVVGRQFHLDPAGSCIYFSLPNLALFVLDFPEIPRSVLIFFKPVVTSTVSARDGTHIQACQNTDVDVLSFQ